MANLFVGQQHHETRNIDVQRRGKIADSYGYPTSVPRKHIVRLSHGKILTKYWLLYCKHSSLVGLKYFANDKVMWYEKFLWLLVYSFTMYMVITFVYIIYYEYSVTPIVSTPEGESFPTYELEFPAVAVCTVNRISLRSATKLATEMFEAKISNLTVNEIIKEISKLGDLYDSSFVRADDYTQTTQLLSKFYNNNYDITDIMELLTPHCAATFLFCYFRNEKQDCSNIFNFAKTKDGYCCTFNYVYEVDDMPKHEEPKIYMVGNVGMYYGLSVSINLDLDDYLYTILPITGWKVMIFDSYDYPDSSSGSVTEVLIAPLTEKYIQLEAVGLYSAEIIRSYPIEKRGCIFKDEQQTDYNTYTKSDCVVACKLAHVWRNCKCRPFYYPRQASTKSFKRTCTVDDIPCLLKYDDDYYDIFPFEVNNLSSAIEDKDATIICNNCYPECYDMTYIVRSSASDLQRGYTKSQFFPGINVTDQSIIHIYFSESGTRFLKRNQNYRWYEHLSDAGGVCGLFLGFSIVSLVEIIYFILLCLLELFNPPETMEDEILPKNAPSLYWNEFF